MNSKTYVTIALLLFVLFPVCGFAADLKIGVVDGAKVIQMSPQADKARGVIEKEFAPREKEIIQMEKEIKALEEKMVREGAVMSESGRRKVERDILSKRRDLRRDQEEAREDYNLRFNEEMGKLQRQILTVINQVAKEGKFDLILSEGVVYASDSINITDKVLQKLKSTTKSSK